MKFKKVLSLSSALLLLGSLGITFFVNSNTEKVAAAEVPTKELQSDELSVITVSSTTTAVSQSYQVNFSSEISAYTDEYKSVYVTIAGEGLIDPNTGILTYPASVYQIVGTRNNHDIVIPSLMRYGTQYDLKIMSIASKAVSTSKNVDPWKNISSIVIPSNVTFIEANAFENVPSTVNKIRTTFDSKPYAWAENWYTPAEGVTPVIEWSTQLSQKEASIVTGTSVYGAPTKFGSGRNFIIGYYDLAYAEGKYYKPLIAHFQVKTASGKTEARTVELSLSASNTSYDGVGEDLGFTSVTKYVDIPLETGETVDDTSLYFTNIYEYKRDEQGNIVPDIDLVSYKAFASKQDDSKYDFSEFISYSFYRSSDFSGYFQVDILADKVDGIYKKLMPAMYLANKDALESGKAYVRYQLASLSLATYSVTYMVGNEERTTFLPVNSPYTFYNIPNEKGNIIGFILKMSDIDPEFNMAGLKSVNIEGLYIKLDIWSNTLESIVTRSQIATRFGIVPLYRSEAEKPYYNLNVILGIACGIYSAAFILLAFLNFLYRKHRFKNDEFLRVDNKKYLKKSVRHYFGFALAFLSIMFIVFRWGYMNTSIVAYNPLDVYVIIFTILGLVYVGIVIKDIVVSIHVRKQAKKAAKLKLENDVAEDGTN